MSGFCAEKRARTASKSLDAAVTVVARTSTCDRTNHSPAAAMATMPRMPMPTTPAMIQTHVLTFAISPELSRFLDADRIVAGFARGDRTGRRAFGCLAVPLLRGEPRALEVRPALDPFQRIRPQRDFQTRPRVGRPLQHHPSRSPFVVPQPVFA